MIKKLLLLNCALLLARLAWCTRMVLAGKVQEDMGSPLPGLSLLWRGTSIGTLSVANGGYPRSFPSQVFTSQSLCPLYPIFCTDEN